MIEESRRVPEYEPRIVLEGSVNITKIAVTYNALKRLGALISRM